MEAPSGMILLWGWCDHGCGAVLDSPVHRAESASEASGSDRFESFFCRNVSQ
jgi:hypothetical protein